MEQFNDFNNDRVAALPAYLRQYVVDQYYEHYTPVDQAVWRYVMRQNYSFLKDVAYYPYIPGLQAAGLTIEHIPNLQEMNDALGKIGWGAVTVDGFIPPAAFMAFQAHHVLVIAADIRQLEHIQYTPAPDIIHESAGHAPIIADEAYNQYLSYFGSIGEKAMFSAKDFELYEAIRELSILKEMAGTSVEDLQIAEKKVEICQTNLGEPSEMALLSRLHWWTVEYGLIGTLDDPKIYGAGLLSSIGESASCMKQSVQKLEYTIDAVNYPFDITKEQPQLFVTPTFENLVNTLDQFANTMAFRKGGKEALSKAIISKNVATAVYSSGLQVSGLITDIHTDENDEPCYIVISGPSALSIDNKQLPDHGKDDHQNGFSSPVGKLKGINASFEEFDEKDLDLDSFVVFEFESGIKVSGKLERVVKNENKLALLSFTACEVKNKDGAVLFSPDMGVYDMAVGDKIVSVFSGAADKDRYEEIAVLSSTRSWHPVYTEKDLVYHRLFSVVRRVRELGIGHHQLVEVWYNLKKDYPEDWLCSIEILEILEQANMFPNFAEEVRSDLKLKESNRPELSKLIQDGFNLIKNPVRETEEQM